MEGEESVGIILLTKLDQDNEDAKVRRNKKISRHLNKEDCQFSAIA